MKHKTSSHLLHFWSVLFCFLFVVAVLLYGFTKFVETVHNFNQDETLSAQGIVVLTGETSRIRTGIALVERKIAQKLFISGIDKTAIPSFLNTLKNQKPELFSCCIQYGYLATNTVGNAYEISKWVKEQRFKKIIVVTSGYHMPRAMTELLNKMPEITLIPYPANTSFTREIWQNSEQIKRYSIEYFKYIAALVRIKIERMLL